VHGVHAMYSVNTQNGKDAAVLVRRLGQPELLEDLGYVGFHGPLGHEQPGGDAHCGQPQ
jgi:hypothetical protein